jgi:membrane-associated phospholipid phosphatase
MTLVVDLQSTANGTVPRPSTLGGWARASRDYLVALAALSRRNTGLTIAQITRRHASRPAFYVPLPWRMPTMFVVAAIVYTMLFVDVPVAAYRGQWPLWLRQPTGTMTDVGLGIWYILPATLLAFATNLTDWSRRTRRQLLVLYNRASLAMLVLIATGLSGLAAAVLKRIIGRARPSLFDEHGVFGFRAFAIDPAFASFPSGHSTILGSLAALLWLYFPRWRFVTLPLLFLCANTRVIVSSHHPSDVIAGFGFGFVFAVLTAMVFARLGYLFRAVHGRLPSVKRSARVFW